MALTPDKAANQFHIRKEKPKKREAISNYPEKDIGK